MPFPPTYDHAWDITQPPDTQVANLLGQDSRNLKDDIMQRMSLLSGTLANRPTPETVNATWGGSGFGLIYLATDTNQIFQWNGTSWVVIAGLSTQRYSDLTTYTTSNASITTTGITIPANTLIAGSIVKAKFWGYSSGSGTQEFVEFLVNGNAMQNVPVSANQQFELSLELLVISSSVARVTHFSCVNGFAYGAGTAFVVPLGVSGFSTANALVINSLLAWASGGTLITQQALDAVVWI